ncbi:PadR family transcriptional regulator [Paenibacillus oenotherae]|uniref:PadR family transcriptional regulator n=1 Tax=Paenibacillus oenotherae TaxID=1435645 RepID=A0ABS7D5H0_9BACL|nr:PadR family transcriptional regulator [Paenibacillus oenotherae]MBW7475140.1 PadR family transcriptional regulator [Paenibacillus oenotherae]
MTSQDVILGILMKKKLAGYDIKLMFESVFSYFYNASFGTIYPTLGKMEKEGLITKENVIQDGKPNKHIYSITEEGRKRFYDYLYSDIQASDTKSDFMVRLYFGDLADRGRIIQWLKNAIRRAEYTSERLETDYERLKDTLTPTQIICIRLGIESSANKKKVLMEGLQQIESLEE